MSKTTAADFRISAESLATTLTLAWSSQTGTPVRVTGLMVRNVVRDTTTVKRLQERPAQGSRQHVYTGPEAYAIADFLAARVGGRMGRVLKVTLDTPRPASASAKAKTTRKPAAGGGTVRVSVKPADKPADAPSA